MEQGEHIVYRDVLAELKIELVKYLPAKTNSTVKQYNMDNFNPVFWSVYVFMALFLGFLAWEIIKMVIAVITGKFIKEDRKKKAHHARPIVR